MLFNWIKQGYLRKSCLTNCDRLLKFMNFENGGTDIQRGIIAFYYEQFDIVFTVDG